MFKAPAKRAESSRNPASPEFPEQKHGPAVFPSAAPQPVNSKENRHVRRKPAKLKADAARHGDFRASFPRSFRFFCVRLVGIISSQKHINAAVFSMI